MLICLQYQNSYVYLNLSGDIVYRFVNYTQNNYNIKKLTYDKSYYLNRRRF